MVAVRRHDTGPHELRSYARLENATIPPLFTTGAVANGARMWLVSWSPPTLAVVIVASNGLSPLWPLSARPWVHTEHPASATTAATMISRRRTRRRPLPAPRAAAE